MQRLDRFTWGIVIGVLALVVVGVVVAASAVDRGTPPDLSTPEGVALAYELALQRGDWDTAYSLLAQTLQEQVPRDQFALRAGGSFGGGYQASARLSVEPDSVQGDTARVTLVRSFPPSGGLLGLAFDRGSTVRFNVTLVREGGAWRVSVPPEPYLVLPRGG
jgi:hypothetical protein